MICKVGDRRYWRHQWTKWEDSEAVINDPDGGCSRSVLIQDRRCARCNHRDVRRIIVRD